MRDFKKAPLADRILAHYVIKAKRGAVSYHELMRAVFPPGRAWRVSSNGGPPGCAMAFGAALRRLGGQRTTNRDEGTDTVWIPMQR